MSSIHTGLLLGYGSVGRRHAKTLAGLFPELAIVETKEDGRVAAAAEFPQACVAASLADLRVDWQHTAAVIATWGPSHAQLFHALADLGVRHILCEKPIASSIADARSMAERAARDGISLSVHHYIRYAGLVPALRQLFAEHALGEPVSVIVEGGAACLLTNGVHWIDFATELFGSEPLHVISTAAGEPINPRSPDLSLYGGTAIWTYSGRREAVITFSNLSSIALRTQVFLRDAVALIDDSLNVTLRRRDPAAVQKFPAVTRTGPASEELFRGPMPGVQQYLDGMRSALLDACDGARISPASVGVSAVSACISALVASRDGCRTAILPAGEAAWLRELWPIS